MDMQSEVHPHLCHLLILLLGVFILYMNRVNKGAQGSIYFDLPREKGPGRTMLKGLVKLWTGFIHSSPSRQLYPGKKVVWCLILNFLLEFHTNFLIGEQENLFFDKPGKQTRIECRTLFFYPSYWCEIGPISPKKKCAFLLDRGCWFHLDNSPDLQVPTYWFGVGKWGTVFNFRAEPWNIVKQL